jgi:hypothetical protein
MVMISVYQDDNLQSSSSPLPVSKSNATKMLRPGRTPLGKRTNSNSSTSASASAAGKNSKGTATDTETPGKGTAAATTSTTHLSSKPSVDRSCLHRSLVLARVMLIMVVKQKRKRIKKASPFRIIIITTCTPVALPWTRRMALQLQQHLRY